MVQRQSANARFDNVIGGRMVEARNGQRLDSYDPSTGTVWASVPAGTADDVGLAVDAAQLAFEERWRPLRAAERSAHLRRLADALATHSAELAEIESRDCGRLLTETAGGDLPACVEMLHYFAGAADKLGGDTIAISRSSFNFTLREAIGVVGIIVPWNAPLSIACAKIGAALAAGNTVVVKPAEQASAALLRMASIFLAAGLPDGVVNVVAGLGEVAGAALVEHPGIGRITFTGSTDTARVISSRAGQTLTPLHFELGGKSANIVFADADLDAATHGVTTSSIYTGNAGQTCIAGSRILIHESIFDEMLARIEGCAAKIQVGHAFDPNATMGPIVSREQLDRVSGYVNIGRAEGAELVFGGRTSPELFEADDAKAGGYYVEPTLFRTSDPGLRVCQEEIFGPVAVAMPFRDDDEALQIANGTNYGLAAGVWTSDLGRAHRFVRDLDTGVVWVNTYRKIHWAAPFGGVKDSGYGRDSGWESVLENTRIKTAWLELD